MIIVTTANICGNPIRARWAVRRRMRRALAAGGVTFGQEVAASNRFRVGRGNYSTAWHRLAQAAGMDTYGDGVEVPISLPRTTWEVLTHEVTQVHPGLAHVSPARYLNAVVARQIGSGLRVGFVNCHPVSKPRPGVDHAGWRMAHWSAYHAALAAAVTELAGQTDLVVFGGDLNKRAVPRINAAQVTLVARGLDHLWAVCSPGVMLAVSSRTVVGRTVLMDHPILTVGLTVTRRTGA